MKNMELDDKLLAAVSAGCSDELAEKLERIFGKDRLGDKSLTLGNIADAELDKLIETLAAAGADADTINTVYAISGKTPRKADMDNKFIG